jgi:hypothetical protein
MTRKLMRYIREHNKTAKPIKWKYVDVTHRLRAPHSAVTVHLGGNGYAAHLEAGVDQRAV